MTLHLRVVLLTDVLIGQVLGDRAPAELLRVFRRYTNLELGQTRELYTVDGAALSDLVDVLVDEATRKVLVVGMLVVGIDRDLERFQRLAIHCRQRVDDADKTRALGSRAVRSGRADRSALDVHGRVRNALEFLVVN